ncbi:selenocysteine lyase/cysteine desulfurase [Chitinophaga dinghuensis]|uniref:Selenocysteine lyase/cysteine desulfurase n=1 Tax=Chitinophaga dinghuensis TaxID=1539050 RepID=A0A327VLM1_9BACT|nr:aminotransferase class V-fold PLP-dependent enzyme [Chitinophaga dinghuensis]RAJ75694.1 selenocysteine lyase/cysteine desulfurase [Chitinophaga dinghuensis]
MKTTLHSLENYFSVYRQHIIGYQQYYATPFGLQRIVYGDWTATGRGYSPIEKYIQQDILPFIGNTHTDTTVTGSMMSSAYEMAKDIIKKHVNASTADTLLFCGIGMTSAVNKLQRIMGLKSSHSQPVDNTLRPIVFVTQMEHHSNHISWLETIAHVELIGMDEKGNVDISHLHFLLEQYKDHPIKIAAVTACSNVTGIVTPYHEIAKLIHAYDGWCLVDFACAAPYCEINMHPEEAHAQLDAIYFSAHKFLGGPGTPGILVFNNQLYQHQIPDQPGGGVVQYTNPWGVRDYMTNIEQREDGGTPPFIQGIKAAMCIRLKEEMGVANILKREKELLDIIFSRLVNMSAIHVLQGNVTDRLGVISFLVEGVHYNLFVKLMNDRFGIQLRGGCSCAGTYGHHLLQVDQTQSYIIRQAIQAGDMSAKPGWIRLSIHPTMTDAEINFILDAIEITIAHAFVWQQDYYHDRLSNEYIFTGDDSCTNHLVSSWFNSENW